ncbi:hypothetical protein [Agarivorans sp. Z349TD_8]|uniref:hypothetical protein n=1 Tax=Agarivorans sp. Z349TD_8 TaxID=3421434 RepID=UPI003D7DA478
MDEVNIKLIALFITACLSVSGCKGHEESFLGCDWTISSSYTVDSSTPFLVYKALKSGKYIKTIRFNIPPNRYMDESEAEHRLIEEGEFEAGYWARYDVGYEDREAIAQIGLISSPSMGGEIVLFGQDEDEFKEFLESSVCK